MSIAVSSLVRYRITPTEHGIKLEIWELPANPETAQVPFLFRIKYYFPTLSMAEQALNCHLSNNDLMATPEPMAKPEAWVIRKLFSIFDTQH